MAEEEECSVVFVPPLFDSSCVVHEIKSLGKTVTLRTRSRDRARASGQHKGEEPPLFADDVWPGARALSDHLDEHSELCAGKTVLELGAGCGLPSVVACKLGASLCVCTDYPADGVIENIATQLVSCGVDPAVALAVGHKWGEDCSALLAAGGARTAAAGGFDTLLLAELLWKDTRPLHRALLRSVVALLAPAGVALVALVHRPTGPAVTGPRPETGSGSGSGLEATAAAAAAASAETEAGHEAESSAAHSEEEDLAFFALAEAEFGLRATGLGRRMGYCDALGGGGARLLGADAGSGSGSGTGGCQDGAGGAGGEQPVLLFALRHAPPRQA